MEEKTANEARRTLLIVDDDIEWTDLLARFFARSYKVKVANTARDGIAVILTERPSAMILDLVMPSVDGFGLMHRLKAMSAGRIPAVLTTGWGAANLEHCAASIGFAAVLAKPVSLEELDNVVRFLMEDSRASETN